MSNPTSSSTPSADSVTDEILPPEAPATEANGQPDAASSQAPDGDALMTKLQADLGHFRDLALRSQADFENFRKRSTREREDAVKFANSSLLEKLIPIVDNFELGLTAAKGSAEGSAILTGMEMVSRQLQDFLSQHGVEAVAAEGQKFDPNLHEAFAQEESNEVPEGNVVRQLRRGYKLRERLLRPAAVVVSKGPASA